MTVIALTKLLEEARAALKRASGDSAKEIWTERVRSLELRLDRELTLVDL